MYFSDVLYIAVSEIAYYRYLLPESCFEDALFEGKSAEADQLLDIVNGAGNALTRGFIKVLAIGLFLHRLILFLREMEPLLAPIMVSARLALNSSAPADYAPAPFLLLPQGQATGYSILPEFGCAQVGALSRGGIEAQMCIMCVEGPVQQPALGSTRCLVAARLEVDTSPDRRVLVAVPGMTRSPEQTMVTRRRQKEQALSSICASADTKWEKRCTNKALRGQNCECQVAVGVDEEMWTCYRCKRKVHAACYKPGGKQQAPPMPTVCISCQVSDGSKFVTAYVVSRLARARRLTNAALASREGRLHWLVEQAGFTKYRGMTTAKQLQALGIIQIHKTPFPQRFKADSDEKARTLLAGGDLEAALAAIEARKE
ncbi:hypothetical protein GGF46_003199 [Coemansia sp. RSA 552]|nr:hypothetical protein GGF46_003199 [Coemansia sp. RSA 552]